MSKSYVLDASAFLGLRKTAPGGKRVEQLFKDALLQRTRVLMSVLNLCEVFYHSWQQSRPAESGLVTKSHLSIAWQGGWRSCTKLFW